MAFTINKNLFFIDSMQFMNSSLDALVKHLSDNLSNNFNHLSQEFSVSLLELVKEKGVYSVLNDKLPFLMVSCLIDVNFLVF